MKIRTGFVSNSSSSSFLVICYKELKTDEDYDEIIPECIECFRYFKSYEEKVIITRKELVAILKKDLQKISKADALIMAINLAKDVCIDEEVSDDELKQYDIKSLNENMFLFYKVNYSDDSDIGNFMEHQFMPLIAYMSFSHH